LGYTFVVCGDDDAPQGKQAPPVALRFALAQTRAGLEEYTR
jgi:hypothetical protein